ncbi:drug/metabolite transporter (DMT)-like permease [Labrenzia sp. EL_159]|uniref:DMT family transporter n=1 Tax=Roseibium album TaxID=311410 RepID=UPI0018C8E8D9|nr:DMT family transporter [Roseibium album]MBG6154883.1 drug/metabolite transporter (DMT)-like permease [Labrenzia sp. EL_162]MBG6192987.1 drug/metabolite transporter (DMT)-like permease [Labrenzia sp. EL_159]
MSVASPAIRNGSGGFSAMDYGLYAATVLAWGFSWIAMKSQVATVAPEVSVFWRFVLAAAVMMAWAKFRGHNMSFPAQDHFRFAGLGAFLFSTNFTLFYYGAMQIPSGLLAVIFSTASIFNLFLGLIVFGQRPNPLALLAGTIGFAGIALMFWPKLVGAEFNTHAAIGLGICVAGTLSFCVGNMVSADTQRRGIGVVPATAWGMFYGMMFLGLFSAIRGQSFAVEWSISYFSGLVYLAIFASVIAFASYLTLLGRIGSARAGYATVMFPVVALTLSTIFEGYQWTTAAALGVVFVLGGNILMLRAR